MHPFRMHAIGNWQSVAFGVEKGGKMGTCFSGEREHEGAIGMVISQGLFLSLGNG